MDEVDALKKQRPILGERKPLDYGLVRQAVIPEQGMTIEAVTSDLVSYYAGLAIPGHPQTQQNVVPPPTITSLIGVSCSLLSIILTCHGMSIATGCPWPRWRWWP